MPPKKPAKEAKEDNTNEVIFNYLKEQNRPYSATEISSNLHNKVTKTKAEKALKEMHEKGLIGGRMSGKASAYWPLQDPKDSASPEELKALDDAIASIRGSIPALKAETKSKSLALATLRSAPTTEGLRDAVQELQAKKKDMSERLRVLRSGVVKPVSQEERENAETEFRAWTRKREARKRAFGELEGLLMEQMEMKRAELREKLDIEDDP